MTVIGALSSFREPSETSPHAPAGTWNHMSDSNPAALFRYIAEQLNRFGVAYLHITNRV
jgi:N-ethylmaleimide reductase